MPTQRAKKQNRTKRVPKVGNPDDVSSMVRDTSAPPHIRSRKRARTVAQREVATSPTTDVDGDSATSSMVSRTSTPRPPEGREVSPKVGRVESMEVTEEPEANGKPREDDARESDVDDDSEPRLPRRSKWVLPDNVQEWANDSTAKALAEMYGDILSHLVDITETLDHVRAGQARVSAQLVKLEERVDDLAVTVNQMERVSPQEKAPPRLDEIGRPGGEYSHQVGDMSRQRGPSEPLGNWVSLPYKYEEGTSFEVFLKRIAPRMAKIASDADKIDCLNEALPSRLLEFIMHQPIRDYSTYVETLKRYLVPYETQASLLNQLTERRQKAGETVREYVSELRALAAKAFPGEDLERIQREKLNELLIYGLADRDAQIALTLHAPKDLDELLAIADKFETLRIKRGKTQKEADKDNHPYRGRASPEETGPKGSKPSKSKQARGGKTLPADASRLRENLRGFSKSPNRRERPDENRANDRQEKSRVTGRDGKALICYECNKPGHIRPNCPLKRHQSRKDDARPPMSPGKGKPPIRMMDGVCSGSCQVAVNINGEELHAIVDTGASASFVAWETVQKRQIAWDQLRSPKEVRVADGRNLRITKVAWCDMVIGGRTYTTQFYVALNLGADEVLLGYDFLEYTNGGILAGAKKLLLDGGEVEVPIVGRGTKTTARVLTCRRIVIGPRSEDSVPVKYEGVSMGGTFKQYLVEPQLRLPRGLLVPHMVVAGSGLPDELFVMNLHSTPLVVEPDLVLARMDPAEDAPDDETGRDDPQTHCRITEIQRPTGEGRDASPMDAEVHVGRHERNLDPFESLDKELEQMVDLRHLPEARRDALMKLLCRYRHVFLCKGQALGRTQMAELDIDTGNARPVKVPPRRMPQVHKRVVETELQKMQDEGIIRPSTSPWSSPVVLVTKKNGDVRFCVDYRGVNAVTKGDSYPLPRIDETLEYLEGHAWFTTLDLKSGYWQVPLAEDAKPKTAFSCHRGLFEFEVLPFGLKCAPAKFMRMMDVVLSGLKPEKCLVYLDDTVVMSRTFDEHLQNLELVLRRFEEANLKLNPEKCHWALNEVGYLGHIVSAEGLRTDPRKIEAVDSWPCPKTIKDVRAFLGLTGYYRKFIRSYAEAAKPLTRLTRKLAMFQWGEEEQEAFEKLKSALCSAPILQFPDWSDEGAFFKLETDASDTAIGGVLTQVKSDSSERVVCYGSKTLSLAEQKYCVTRKELLAVVYFTHEWRAYLYGKKFQIWTDHAALKWLKTLKEPQGQLARWAGQLTTYDFEIHHRKGTCNGNADALSRKHNGWSSCPSCQETKQIGQLKRIVDIEGTLAKSIQAAQRDDPVVSRIIALLKRGVEKPPPVSKDDAVEYKRMVKYWEDFFFKDECLYSMGSFLEDEPKLVVPRSWRAQVLKEHHDVAQAGHLGITKTLRKVRQNFIWPGLKRDVVKWVSSCKVCQEMKGKPGRAPLQPIRSTYFNELLCSDVVGPLPTTPEGNQYILTFIDHFSKWAEAVPVRDHTAATVCRVMVDTWICRYGTPTKFLTDQGAEFEGELMKELVKVFDIKKLRTTPLHPQTNGVTERVQRTFKQILTAALEKHAKDEWDKALPWALYAYRSSLHETTGYTPYEVLFGGQMALPFVKQMGLIPPSYEEVDDYVKDTAADRMKILGTVWRNAEQARAAQKKAYDKKVNQNQTGYKKGDKVLVYQPNLQPGEHGKFKRQWEGPWVVVEQSSALNVKVAPLHGRKKTIVIHTNRVKPYSTQTREKPPKGQGINNRKPGRPRRQPTKLVELDDLDVAENVEI